MLGFREKPFKRIQPRVGWAPTIMKGPTGWEVRGRELVLEEDGASIRATHRPLHRHRIIRYPFTIHHLRHSFHSARASGAGCSFKHFSIRPLE